MKIELIANSGQPLNMAAASARTCYSQKLVLPERVGKTKKQRIIRDSIVDSTREAGHLTTRQHATFTFSMEGISRGVTWSFLHAHPFYNTEQQSQRYVEVKDAKGFTNFLMPGVNANRYLNIIEIALVAYNALIKLLYPSIREKYFTQFPARQKNADKWDNAIRKLCLEEARYVLPMATHTNLYYTISSLTLMRMAAMSTYSDYPYESNAIVQGMVNAVKDVDPEWITNSGDIDISEDTSPNILRGDIDIEMFDTIQQGYSSKLIKSSSYSSVPEMYVTGWSSLPNHNHNPMIAHPLNLYSCSREMNLLATTSFSFSKKMSLTAHSQQQRHRSLRGYWPFFCQDELRSEWITPKNISESPEANELYQMHMENYMYEVKEFQALGSSNNHTDQYGQHAYYLLPNAYPVRFIESGDFLSYFHLWKQRLCLLAQNEIFECSKEEVTQVLELSNSEVSKQLKDMLGAPCHLRYRAGTKPYCPEGKRFCGQKVWEQSVQQLERLF